MFTMFSIPRHLNPNYQQGRADGFAIAEGYLKDLSKDFYKHMKKGLLARKVTTHTLSTHKCNCEFCDLDVK